LRLLAAMSAMAVFGCAPASEAVPVVSTSPVVSTLPVVAETTTTTLADPNRQTPGLFYSPRVGDYFKIYVHVPDDYETDTDAHYPVIYILDGDWYFDGTNRLPGGLVGIVSPLVAAGDMAPAILVGIGYPGATGRGRDFLQTPRAFHAFVVSDLIPAIDERFRTVPTDRTLIGHSDGAYSAVHALLRFMDSDDPPFTKYIAISGNYNKGTLIWDAEERLHRRAEVGGVPIALYLAVGGMDEPEFVESGRRLADVLVERDYDNLHLRTLVYGGAGHGDVIRRAFIHGLKWQFSSSP
jgi:enterochelin esterase-like enzyme